MGSEMCIRDSSDEGVLSDPVLVSDLLNVTGYEEVRSINIKRLASSKSYQWLDKKLELSFRLRERFGLPMFKGNVPVINPLWIDYSDPKINSLGKFPIEYTISFDGIEKEESGLVTVQITPEKISKIIEFNRSTTTNFKLLADRSPPNFGETQSTSTRTISFLKGGNDGLSKYLADDNNAPAPELVQYEVHEFTSMSDQWMEFTDEFGFKYVFVDRNKDSILDEFFSDLGNENLSDWHLMKPTSTEPYVPLDRILDFSKDRNIIEQVADIIKKN